MKGVTFGEATQRQLDFILLAELPLNGDIRRERAGRLNSTTHGVTSRGESGLLSWLSACYKTSRCISTYRLVSASVLKHYIRSWEDGTTFGPGELSAGACRASRDLQRELPLVFTKANVQNLEGERPVTQGEAADVTGPDQMA